MLIDDFNETNRSMKQLQKVEAVAQNQQQKQQNDSDYKNTINMLVINLQLFKYAHKNLNFNLQDVTIQNINDCIQSAKNVVNEAGIEETNLASFKYKFNKIVMPNIRKEWNSYYIHKQSGYDGNLEILSGLTDDGNKIKVIRSQLIVASKWDNLSNMVSGSNNLERYKDGIDQLNNLLNEQHLNDDVKRFLMAVSHGNANFSYLTKEVIDWIRQQNMEDKLSIGFASNKS